MIQEAVQDLIAGADLGRVKARAVMDQIMSGGATDAQIGAFLVALRIKGETVDEIVGCAEGMREKATPIKTSRTNLIDTCGTGGDGLGTFNISTTVAFVADTRYVMETDRLLDGRVALSSVPKERALDVDDEFDLFVADLVLREAEK